MHLRPAQVWVQTILNANSIQGICLCDRDNVYSPVGLLEHIYGESLVWNPESLQFETSEGWSTLASEKTLSYVEANTDLSFIDDLICDFSDKHIHSTIQNFPFLKLTSPSSLRMQNRYFIANYIATNYNAL